MSTITLIALAVVLAVCDASPEHHSGLHPKIFTVKGRKSDLTKKWPLKPTKVHLHDPTKKPKPSESHWPDCTIYAGVKLEKAEWNKFYEAIATVLHQQHYNPNRMGVWSACKQVNPKNHHEKWVAAFWDSKTEKAHSCAIKFSHDPITRLLSLIGGPACHVESVDLCPSQMLGINRCKYPTLL